MSCHVMSCRYYCIDSHRNILETFLSIKNFIKHFAGIFTRSFAIKKLSFANGVQWERGLEKVRSNLFKSGLLHSVRNDEKSKSRNDKCNDEKSKSCTRCAPHGDDKSFCNDKNFQFDKYWRLFFNELFSVIYKKNLLIWRFCL